MQNVQRVTLVQRVVVLLAVRHHLWPVDPRVQPFITALVEIKPVIVRHLKLGTMPPIQQ